MVAGLLLYLWVDNPYGGITLFEKIEHKDESLFSKSDNNDLNNSYFAAKLP